eukprot:1138372-Pelagomonas_calceolata.AAC.1
MVISALPLVLSLCALRLLSAAQQPLEQVGAACDWSRGDRDCPSHYSCVPNPANISRGESIVAQYVSTGTSTGTGT